MSLAFFSPGIAGAANIVLQANNRLQENTDVNVVVKPGKSVGRVCGMIGGVAVAQNPRGACPGPVNGPLNGPIPPNRKASRTIAGNSVAGTSSIIGAAGFLKGYFVQAQATAKTKNVFAEAELADPITFVDPLDDPFEVTLTKSWEQVGDTPGFEISGGPGLDGSYYADMSTNLTGFLFSVDLSFTAGQPLGVSVDLGAYLAGQTGWSTLASDLSAALGASIPGESFSLSDFTFPDIAIDVGAGETLIVSTDDVATVEAAAAPEPRTVALFALPAVCFVFGGNGYGADSSALLTVANQSKGA